MTPKGFTLLEFLISLALASILILAGFGFCVHAHSLFFKLKGAMEESQEALSAIDRMRIDLIRAGTGLAVPGGEGIPGALRADADTLTIRRAERAFGLTRDIAQADQQVSLSAAEGLKAGARICVVGPDGGETADVLRIEGNTLITKAPLVGTYNKETSRILALEEITYFLDASAGIIRRRVDSGGAQPLVEGVLSFRFEYDESANLASLAFTLSPHKEKVYELCLLPKNIGLSQQR